MYAMNEDFASGIFQIKQNVYAKSDFAIGILQFFPNQRYSVGVLEDPERLDTGWRTVLAGAAFLTGFPL